MRLTVKPSERWIFIGKTGSGKTIYSKFLLRPISAKMQVLIIDIKNAWLGDNPVWEKNRNKPGTVDLPHLVKKFNPKFQVQVIQPIKYDEDLEKSLDHVLKHRNVFVHIDDTAGLCTANSVPDGINRIWTQGRALGVGATVGSQTYNRIPSVFRTQAEKFLAFKVGKDDAKDVADLVNVTEDEIRNLGEFEYFYYDVHMDTGLWMPPLKLEEPVKLEKVG